MLKKQIFSFFRTVFFSLLILQTRSACAMCMAGQTRGWKWPLTAVGTSSAILYPLRPIYNYLPLYSSAAGTSNVADTQHEGARVATLLFVLIILWYYQVFTAVWWGKIFPCVYLYYNLKWRRGLKSRIAQNMKHHAGVCRGLLARWTVWTQRRQ